MPWAQGRGAMVRSARMVAMRRIQTLRVRIFLVMGLGGCGCVCGCGFGFFVFHVHEEEGCVHEVGHEDVDGESGGDDGEHFFEDGRCCEGESEEDGGDGGEGHGESGFDAAGDALDGCCFSFFEDSCRLQDVGVDGVADEHEECCDAGCGDFESDEVDEGDGGEDVEECCEDCGDAGDGGSEDDEDDGCHEEEGEEHGFDHLFVEGCSEC